MLPFFLSALVFGFTAGLSPGPLLTLVITETLKHNRKEGFKVALAPILADAPIVLAMLFLLEKLSDAHVLLGIISLLGAAFVAYLGYESLHTKGLELDIKNTAPQSIKKGLIVNALNPHPYLFWITIGAPLTLKAYDVSLGAALVFIGTFYVLLVGSKMTIAVLVDKSRNVLKNPGYVWTMRLLGLVLFAFAILFIRDGLTFLQLT